MKSYSHSNMSSWYKGVVLVISVELNLCWRRVVVSVGIVFPIRLVNTDTVRVSLWTLSVVCVFVPSSGDLVVINVFPIPGRKIIRYVKCAWMYCDEKEYIHV